MNVSEPCLSFNMKRLPLSSKLMNRFMNTFTSQVARRGLRAAGLPRHVIPLAIGFVREINRQIQWGNKHVWTQRINSAKQMYGEFSDWQQQVSPVYRFRGGSATVRPHLSRETVRDKYRDPPCVPQSSKRIDSSTLFVAGLGIVVIASMAGPWLAKKVHFVDPLDLREQSINNNSPSFDLKL